MTALDNVCDVCQRKVPKVWVHASSVVPMSFASCADCLNNYAEMEGTFHYLYDMVGTKGEGIAEWVNELSTWKDGMYLSWKEWVDWRRNPIRVEELDRQAEEDLKDL